MTDKLCPDISCEPTPLIQEKDKELCPCPTLPEVKECQMVVVKVTSNVNDLQHLKMYSKVCDARHKIEPIEIYRQDESVPATFAHLCPPC